MPPALAPLALFSTPLFSPTGSPTLAVHHHRPLPLVSSVSSLSCALGTLEVEYIYKEIERRRKKDEERGRRKEEDSASIRALGGSRAAKWAPRKGAPKEEEEEEGKEGGDRR